MPKDECDTEPTKKTRKVNKWTLEEKKLLYKKSLTLPKVVGVSYDRIQAIWIAHWRFAGKTFHRYFNTCVYGFEQAYHKAIECRLKNINKTSKNSFISALDTNDTNYNKSVTNSVSSADKKLGLNTNPDDNNEEVLLLKLYKIPIYYILLDLKELSSKAINYTAVDTYSKLCKVIDEHIVNVCQSSSISEIQHYLDLFQHLLDLQALPNTLPIHEQAAYIFTVFNMPIFHTNSDHRLDLQIYSY